MAEGAKLVSERFEVAGDGPLLRGEQVGDGAAIVLCHGITATREQVVHGSVALARKGYRQVAYDARGHGESEPAPAGQSYTYPELADDLERVLAHRVTAGRPLLVGHSMGAHTIVAAALRDTDQIAGIVIVGPVVMGLPPPEAIVEEWGKLAEGFERGGVEGFLAVYDERGHDPAWRETIMRFTRARLEKHRHPEAVAEAMRVIATTQPFDNIDEIEFLDIPALVVASRDEADPGHPYAVAEAYAAKLPQGRLISEAEGQSPLAWQGGRLSREIAAFCEEPEVAGRLGG